MAGTVEETGDKAVTKHENLLLLGGDLLVRETDNN